MTEAPPVITVVVNKNTNTAFTDLVSAEENKKPGEIISPRPIKRFYSDENDVILAIDAQTNETYVLS